MSLDRNALDSHGRVVLVDSAHDLIFRKLNKVEAQVELAQAASRGGYQVIVTDVTGMAAGKFVRIFSIITNFFYTGTILSVSVNTLTLDTSLNADYEAGAHISTGIDNLNVDGSVTPEIFSIRGGGVPDLDLTVHITRLVVQITTDTAVDFGKFGDIVGGLTKGIVLRTTGLETVNLFNVKTNGDFAGLTYDYTPYDAANPGQGVYGLGTRLTFSGQSKMGSVIRVRENEELEMVVQDDLTDLHTFTVVAEGHISEIHR